MQLVHQVHDGALIEHSDIALDAMDQIDAELLSRVLTLALTHDFVEDFEEHHAETHRDIFNVHLRRICHHFKQRLLDPLHVPAAGVPFGANLQQLEQAHDRLGLFTTAQEVQREIVELVNLKVLWECSLDGCDAEERHITALRAPLFKMFAKLLFADFSESFLQGNELGSGLAQP